MFDDANPPAPGAWVPGIGDVVVIKPTAPIYPGLTGRELVILGVRRDCGAVMVAPLGDEDGSGWTIPASSIEPVARRTE